MWWVLKSAFRKEQQASKQAYKEMKDEMVSKREVELMIGERMLELHTETTQTPRTSPQTTSQTTPQTYKRRKADILFNKVEIMQEIASLEELGQSTTEMYDTIVHVKQLCKKSCFFKYLKMVREQMIQTPRTKIAN